MEKTHKKIIVVRHAHRETGAGRGLDNGLSSKGWDQARAIRDLYTKRFGPSPCLLLSSPKTRCIETLEPLSDHLKIPIQIEEDLDENGDLSEKSWNILEIALNPRSPDIVVLSSHGDWIPCFSSQTSGIEIDLNKGGWILFSQAGPQRLHLVEVVQEPILISV